MRLSELLHAQVYDADWRPIGRVEDVRLVQDGPLLGVSGAAFRVDGLVVGRAGLGVRLGFHRANVKGPWPVKAFFGRLERRSRYVEWGQVESWDDEQVRLRVALADLPPVPVSK